MKKVLSLILAVTFILPLCVSCTTVKSAQSAIIPAEGETVLYVSPNGDDTADGTFGKPLATLEGAKAKVRAILPTADGAVSVYFREGDYLMTAGVSFDESDSGREGAPVKYAAYPDERVRFIGGVKVDSSLIKPADPASSVTARVLDDTAKAALMQADVSSLIEEFPAIFHCDYINEDRTDHIVGDWNSMELYLGDMPLEPARWPNFGSSEDQDTFLFDPEKKPIFDYDITTATGTETAIFFYGDDVYERSARWSEESLRDAFISGYLRHSYMGNRVAVTELNRDEKSVHTSPSANGLGFSEGIGGFFQNIPEEIDVPGESYIDRDARIAYFYPGDDFDPDNVWLSTMTDTMMTFDSTEHIAFEGIEFSYSRGSVVEAKYANDFTMTGCRMVHLSSMAAYFDFGKNIHLDRCEIGDTEHGGIYVSGGDRVTLESANVVIENCEFYSVNRDWFSSNPDISNNPDRYDPYCCAYPAALYVRAVGTVVRHNSFHDILHCAILPESNDILIEYNEFARCVSHAADMGTIYYHWNPTFLGMVIRYNYFHDIGNYAENVQYAVYSDNGATGPEIYGNLFVDSAGRVHPGEYKDRKGVIAMTQFTHFYNNVIVNAPLLLRYDDWHAGQGTRQIAWVARNYGFNLNNKYGASTTNFFLEVDFTSDIWKNKYENTFWGPMLPLFDLDKLEEFKTITDEKTAKAKAAAIAPGRTNEMDRNVLVNVGAIANDGQTLTPGQHDNLLDGDLSLFVDAANGDYRLTDEGLARVLESCPGFEPLPLDQIGPQK